MHCGGLAASPVSTYQMPGVSLPPAKMSSGIAKCPLGGSRGVAKPSLLENHLFSLCVLDMYQN